MNKEKALKNQGLEFREDIHDQGGDFTSQYHTMFNGKWIQQISQKESTLYSTCSHTFYQFILENNKHDNHW